MEENNNNLGKKVAISVMSVALLGTSGYLVYDKGFKTAGKEQVKLASNTEEKKMIVLQGRFTVYVPEFSR